MKKSPVLLMIEEALERHQDVYDPGRGDPDCICGWVGRHGESDLMLVEHQAAAVFETFFVLFMPQP